LRIANFFIKPRLVLQQFNQPFHWPWYGCHAFDLG
jgi:hypothetical protein